MTQGEHTAIAIANQYYGDATKISQLKKLGEELVEFTEAMLNGNEQQKLDEAGDMLYIILHLLSKENNIPKIRVNMTSLVVAASEKLEERMKKQKVLGRCNFKTPCVAKTKESLCTATIFCKYNESF